ncbi:hypothetical protein TNCV_4968861 [Trichonephila clavipes]|nr:hypothetical protein TNCV_4968861 [Trichonephila clavipes]
MHAGANLIGRLNFGDPPLLLAAQARQIRGFHSPITFIIVLIPKPDEIGILNEKVVRFVRQINSEVESDDVQDLLDSYNQKLTIDELPEMLEQEQEIEELKSLDWMTVGNVIEGLNLIKKGLHK